MSNTGFSTIVSLLVASCFCYSSAMPTPSQESVNDRPVIGKLKLIDKEMLEYRALFLAPLIFLFVCFSSTAFVFLP